MNKQELTKDKMLGTLYGQAVGNALGIITEFKSKREVKRSYPNGLSSYHHDNGIWQDDDTNQMLCILDELTENGAINPQSLARRLEHWLDTDGRGCGNLVYSVIRHRNFLDDPFLAAHDRWVLSHKEAAPNGGIMRTSVIGLLPSDVEDNAIAGCKVTHSDPRCIGSCVIASLIIHNLVWQDRELSYEEIRAIGERYDERILEWVDLAYKGNLSDLNLEGPEGIGYTLRTLGAALWGYWHAKSFEEGLLAIVNEGGDADTNAAIACAILGAKFGLKGIPQYYVRNLSEEPVYRARVTPFVNRMLS